uniref:Menin n=1 Tax=Rhodnius prolixus TaxID=13249 RepID=T1HZF3_RHOPR
MAGNQHLDSSLFPLEDITSVVKLFKKELEKEDPDLVLLSIIAGAIENSMTCGKNITIPNENELFEEPKLPKLQFHIVNALYTKFHSIIKGSIDLTQYETKYATRELIKKISDVIWNSLTRGYYKDRAHLQSLYSFMTGNKLDCFGVAFAVIAACQVLGFNDVHLALSEDHAWVVFGEKAQFTAEVTWHGKGSEDKRGQPIDAGLSSRSWLYVKGRPVLCSRHMEVAALVSAINPSLTVTTDSVGVATFQQELLWLLYDLKYLDKYPMALGNLAELEEFKPTVGRVPCFTLLQQAILSARRYYDNCHVYPYTYQAGYFYRHALYKQAFHSWANASDVIKQYNYSRDDEEIYKELMEIANELIPHIMKVVSSGHSAHSILKDPECFADLLRFYDGICQWEEGSQTPVLHIGWAKPLVNTISKFDSEVRGRIEMLDVGSSESAAAAEEHSTSLNNNDEELVLTTTGLSLADTLDPKIRALTAACGERILNRQFLLQGGGEPFVPGEPEDEATTSAPCDGSGDPSSSGDASGKKSGEVSDSGADGASKQKLASPKLVLYSHKMRGLKDLLLGEKLNTHAISLQLTAQSQVQVGGRKGPLSGGGGEEGSRSKRTRRE